MRNVFEEGSSKPPLNDRFMREGARSVHRWLTMKLRHLLERNYKAMNRVHLPLSITIPTLAFTKPTKFQI
jgi:hypothetical protein